MGILKNKHAVYFVRRKVPNGLQEAVARVLGNGKARQTFLQKSLDTKDHAAAKRKAPAVLMHFDSVLERARELASAANQPSRTALRPGEIEQIAQHFYAQELAHDERWRFGGEAYMMEVSDWVRRNEPGAEGAPFFPLESLPEHGLSKEQFENRAAQLVEEIKCARECLALGDISLITDDLDVLLADLNIDLDRKSVEYRQLGTEALRQFLRAREAISSRWAAARGYS